MNIRHLITAAFVVVGLIASSAMAGTVTITVSTGLGDTWSTSQEGVPLSATEFSYEGAHSDKTWDIIWDAQADPDPYVAGNFSVTNTGAVAQTYSVTFSAPVSVSISPSAATVGGSTGGSVTDGNSDALGGIQTVPGMPFYRAYLNGITGTPVLDIHNDPFSIPVPFAGGTAAIPVVNVGLPGATIPTGVGILAGQQIVIDHNFTLSPGDNVAFTSFFQVEGVPEPSSLILLGLIGSVLLICRRR